MSRRQDSPLNAYLRVAYLLLEDAGRELDTGDWCVFLLQLRCQVLASHGAPAWDEFLRELGDAA